jgi:hypothetical protein
MFSCSTAPWIERVGLSRVKERIVDDAAGRRALHARFLESQRFSQIDPWAERAHGGDAAEFMPVIPPPSRAGAGVGPETESEVRLAAGAARSNRSAGATAGESA